MTEEAGNRDNDHYGEVRIQTTENIVSPARVQTVPAFRYFFFRTETPGAEIGTAFGQLLPQVFAAKDAAARDAVPMETTGPLVTIYRYLDDARETATLEIGFPVKAGTPASHGAEVRDVPPFRCASLIYWGDIPHIEQVGYRALEDAVTQSGLHGSPEYCEWHHYVEDDLSPNNVFVLQRGVQD